MGTRTRRQILLDHIAHELADEYWQWDSPTNFIGQVNTSQSVDLAWGDREYTPGGWSRVEIELDEEEIVAVIAEAAAIRAALTP